MSETREVDTPKNNNGAAYLERSDPFGQENISNRNRKHDVDVPVYRCLGVADPFHRSVPDDLTHRDG